MDINKISKRILSDNIKSSKKKYFVSKGFLQKVIRKYILDDNSKVIFWGFAEDVDKCLECIAKENYKVSGEYAKRENWQYNSGQVFKGDDEIAKIARLKIDKLVIVSDDIRYLAQMLLLNESAAFEIVDIYDFIKMEFDIAIIKGLSNSVKTVIKEYIKNAGVWLQEKLPLLRKIRCIEYWIKEKKKLCENYDSILVKRRYAAESKKQKVKRYYLKELIINYLMIRDYQNAFTYIDQYTDLFGSEDKALLNIKKDFNCLFSEIKKDLYERQEKDIIIYWCDSMPYSEFKKFGFLKDEAENSLQMENSYTHVAYTHTTAQTIFTGLPFFENGLYDWNRPNFVEHGKTIDLLKEHDYKICEIHSNYTQEKFLRELEYVTKYQRVPASMNLWEVLAQILENKQQKQCIVCHMTCELHPPYWNGTSYNMRMGSNSIYEDEDKFSRQIEESVKYLERQILWYADFLGPNVCKIFMSDHGLGTPRYIEKRIHTFCFVKDKNIASGKHYDYFSYLKFYELLKYILEPTQDNFNNIFTDYVLIQNDHPYSKSFCNDILRKHENKEEINPEKWLGFRGIVKNGYKLIYFANGKELWFDMDDNQIDPDAILGSKLIHAMRKEVGRCFADIYTTEHYKETRKLYEMLHIDLKDIMKQDS